MKKSILAIGVLALLFATTSRTADANQRSNFHSDVFFTQEKDADLELESWMTEDNFLSTENKLTAQAEQDQELDLETWMTESWDK